MNLASYMKTISDRTARTENYVDMIHDYYTMVTPLYRDGWGDSFNFPPFAGSGDLAEATAAQERDLADEGGFRPGWKVLDVGCGVGRPALTIAAHSGAEITGINISPEQVSIARALAAESGMEETVRFVEGDAMKMPFDDESFDAAYVLQSMCHAPDKQAVYLEIARVIKTGGTFLGNDWLCLDGITDAEYAKFIEPICRTWALPYLITSTQLATYLENAGFHLETTGNIAERGNMTRNWEIFEAKSRALANRPDQTPAVQIMRESIDAVVTAARAGFFLVGYWRATKTAR